MRVLAFATILLLVRSGVAVQCPALTLTKQTADKAGPYDVDVVVKVTCEADSHVDGAPDQKEQSLTCQGDGNFDVALKPCVANAAECPVLTLTKQTADSDGPYALATVVKVTCEANSHVDGAPDQNEQSLTCKNDGNFDVALKPCVANAAECPVLTLTKQTADSDGPYALATVVKVTCEANSHVDGAPNQKEQSLTCKNDGTFDPVLKPCVAVQCPVLTLTKQTADSDGPYDATTVVKVTCEANSHVDGAPNQKEQTLTCKNDGTFDVALKPCVAVQCAALTLTKQTADKAGPYDVNDMVKVTCEADSYVEGTAGDTEQTVTCQDTGNFDKDVKPCVGSSCKRITENVKSFLPFQYSDPYKWKAEVTMTCVDKYIVSWATADDKKVGAIKCGTSDTWVSDGFSGTVGCVACTDTVKCTNGNCNNDGECECNPNFKKYNDDPRVCKEITCPSLTLPSIQTANSTGPYKVDAVVKVTCKGGSHVEGTTSETEQTLTCTKAGVFDINLKSCVVCTSDADCTLGTCNDNNECECNKEENKKPVDGKLNECEEVKCPDGYCKNNGVCDVKLTKLECKCKTGTNGTTCEGFTKDPCDPDPCNGDNGDCARVSGAEITDFTKHTCTCKPEFDGDSCEYAKNFNVGDDGYKMSGQQLDSVAFGVLPATGNTPMYIALLKVSDRDGGTHKVLLMQTGDNTYSLHVVDKDMTDTTYDIAITSAKRAVTATTFDILVDTKNQNKLSINANGKVTATGLIANKITDFVIGGKGCDWNDADCLYGKSRIYYHSFMGSFGTLALDGVRQNAATMKSQTGSKMSPLTCADTPCTNGGTCDDATGVIVCKCPPGMVGLDCATYSGGISFNGYTSDFNFGATVVPIVENEQSITIAFDKSATEIGEMLNLDIGGCKILIKAAGGDQYRVADEAVTVAENTITLKLDGNNVKLGDTTVKTCSLDANALSVSASVNLGGSDPVKDSGVTLKDSRYQGCISKIAVNSVDILRITSGNSNNNVETTKCVTDMLPADPCAASSNPCKNEAPCTILLANYTSKCTCNKDPFTEGSNCEFKNYCSAGHACDTAHGTCMVLETKEKCEEAKTNKVKEGLTCEDDKRWYYYCKCDDGWEDDNCGTESVVPTEESKKTDPPKKKSDTTTIVVVVVVVAVVLGVVITIVLVKKRRRASGNGTSNGKTDKGEYSPQAQEKDLEMSGKIEEGAEEPKNLYEDIDVIKNPNAESITEESPPPPPAAVETAIVVEPSDIYPSILPPEDEPPVAEKPAEIAEPAITEKPAEIAEKPAEIAEPAVAVEPSAPQDTPSDQV